MKDPLIDFIKEVTGVLLAVIACLVFALIIVRLI
jgi:hypothetical protein